MTTHVYIATGAPGLVIIDIDDYVLTPSPYQEDVPCTCEGDYDEHFGDHCNHCLSCMGYVASEPCGCGALVSRDCRCDGGEY